MRLTLLPSLALLMAASIVQAQIPQQLRYQGRLLNSANQPITGTQTVVFRLYTVAQDPPLPAPAVPAVWQETDMVALDANGVFATTLDVIAAGNWLTILKTEGSLGRGLLTKSMKF